MAIPQIAWLGLALALLAPMPIDAQPATRSVATQSPGSAADLEIATFGEYVQPGRLPDKSPGGLEKLMLVTITALYNIAGQYGQAMRLCKFWEMKAAGDANETREARACQIAMLVNLLRFTEAEKLAYEEGTFSAIQVPRV